MKHLCSKIEMEKRKKILFIVKRDKIFEKKHKIKPLLTESTDGSILVSHKLGCSGLAVLLLSLQGLAIATLTNI